MVRHCGFWYRGLGPTRVVDGAAMDTRGSCVSFSVNRGSGHLSLQFNKEITQGQARLIGLDNTSTSKSVVLLGEFPTSKIKTLQTPPGCAWVCGLDPEKGRDEHMVFKTTEKADEA